MRARSKCRTATAGPELCEEDDLDQPSVELFRSHWGSSRWRSRESLVGEADARLAVMHVIEPAPIYEPVVMGGPGGPEVSPELRAAARRQLEAAISRDARIYGHVSEVVVSGKPYREIVREARERNSDLVVLGAHGSRVPAQAFGATANHVVREASCPVLTLRAN